MNYITDDIVERLCQSSSAAPLDSPQASAPIGVFQSFRPNGLPETMSAGLSARSVAFTDRLTSIYEAVRSSQRLDNMKDAYFVVRDPPKISASKADLLAKDFLTRLGELADALELESIRRILDERPRVRVLEGRAPKHPKLRQEKCEFLLGLEEELPSQVSMLFSGGSSGERLSEALYFIACDKLLRDYLRWPLLDKDPSGYLMEKDSFQDYFALWKHGIKLRIFNNRQLDVYLPR
jgi:hypothetical protein